MERVLRVAAVLLGALVFRAAAAGPGDGASPGAPVPEQTLIVKGAWPSASDASTPLPEDGRWAEAAYHNDYFGLTLKFSQRWQPGLEGPPPSDSGAYVLAQIVPAEALKDDKPGHLLITAQDIFFNPIAADSALQFVNFTSEHLDRSVYRVEEAPRETLIGRYLFVRFTYLSMLAGMHWTVLATEVRCHVVEFVFVSINPPSMTDLLQSMSSIRLPSTAGVHGGRGGQGAPLCIKDYASADNILERVAPVPTEPRYNTIPVRIIIDRQGKVRHIHFLRAFPEQAKAISDALLQWRFKPHLVDGAPVEVETGIVFGRKAAPVAPTASMLLPPGASRVPLPMDRAAFR